MTPRRASAASRSGILYLLKRVELITRAQLEEITREHNLTPLQYTALSVLVEHEGISAAQLGRLSFVSTQAANEMIAILGDKGFVARRPSEVDRRKLETRLTASGLA